MKFKTTFSLSSPAPAWLLSPSCAPLYCVVENLVAGYDEMDVFEVGGGEAIKQRGQSNIGGTLSAALGDWRTKLDNFLLIVDNRHVVEHCYFVHRDESGGRFVAAYIYHLPIRPKLNIEAVRRAVTTNDSIVESRSEHDAVSKKMEQIEYEALLVRRERDDLQKELYLLRERVRSIAASFPANRLNRRSR